MIEINREELAWAAGFFDGEGCTSVTIDPTWGHMSASVPQVDREILERFHKAVNGIGNIGGPRKPSPIGKHEIYTWRVGSFIGVQAVMAMLWGFLFRTKREQYKKALVRWQARPQWQTKSGRGLKEVCKRGHSMAESRLNKNRVDGEKGNGIKRTCRICSNLSTIACRKRKKEAITEGI